MKQKQKFLNLGTIKIRFDFTTHRCKFFQIHRIDKNYQLLRTFDHFTKNDHALFGIFRLIHPNGLVQAIGYPITFYSDLICEIHGDEYFEKCIEHKS